MLRSLPLPNQVLDKILRDNPLLIIFNIRR